MIVAWRLLEGAASEKGREAEVTRELIEQALELGGPECIGLLLADALYADGPLIAWLAYAKGIDVLTPLPADRRMFADALGAGPGAGRWRGRGIGTCGRSGATSRRGRSRWRPSGS